MGVICFANPTKGIERNYNLTTETTDFTMNPTKGIERTKPTTTFHISSLGNPTKGIERYINPIMNSLLSIQ